MMLQTEFETSVGSISVWIDFVMRLEIKFMVSLWITLSVFVTFIRCVVFMSVVKFIIIHTYNLNIFTQYFQLYWKYLKNIRLWQASEIFNDRYQYLIKILVKDVFIKIITRKPLKKEPSYEILPIDCWNLRVFI